MHFKCTAEHLVARREGGMNIQENIVAACWWRNTARDGSLDFDAHRLMRGVIDDGQALGTRALRSNTKSIAQLAAPQVVRGLDVTPCLLHRSFTGRRARASRRKSMICSSKKSLFTSNLLGWRIGLQTVVPFKTGGSVVDAAAVYCSHIVRRFYLRR